jgi:hypothetical protein
MRLEEFRRVVPGLLLEFVPFDSPEGQVLLRLMEEEACNLDDQADVSEDIRFESGPILLGFDGNPRHSLPSPDLER